MCAKKIRTQQKVEALRKQKEDDAEIEFQLLQNRSLMKKVPKARQEEALQRFENYNERYRNKMENVRRKESEDEEARMRQLFRPKILKKKRSLSST